MDLIFMGTPAFALPALERIYASKHQLTHVVTMPDKPSGRHLKVVPGPVKAWAERHGLPVFQPPNLTEEAVIHAFNEMTFDTALICAYGRIIPDWLLEHSKFGCINIHPSLLPRYRGPSPIETSILNGDRVTGTTIMEVTRKLDSGAILLQQELAISPDDTSRTLSQKLSELSAVLVVRVLDGLEAGSIKAVPQNDALATYTRKFVAYDGMLDLKEPAVELVNKVRAFDPRPGTFFLHKGKRIKVLKAVALEQDTEAQVGTVLQAKDGSAVLATGRGLLQLLLVQPEGKRTINSAELFHGRYFGPGDLIGEPVSERIGE